MTPTLQHENVFVYNLVEYSVDNLGAIGGVMNTVTLLGLGEAGRLYAADLAEAGARVLGYDPYARFQHESVRQHDDLAAAVSPADVVISIVGARAARSVAAQAIPYLRSNSVFADFNTASPAMKAAIAEDATRAGVRFADVAVLAPVPRAGARTPLMASGDGAQAMDDVLRPLGVPTDVIDGHAGAAAGRKLLRSVFMKGLAGVVIETAEAGKLAGSEGWVRAQMADELGPGGDTLVARLIDGTHAHSARRKHEIQDALDYVKDLGLAGWMAMGALEWLTAIDDAKQAAPISEDDDPNRQH